MYVVVKETSGPGPRTFVCLVNEDKRIQVTLGDMDTVGTFGFLTYIRNQGEPTRAEVKELKVPDWAWHAWRAEADVSGILDLLCETFPEEELLCTMAALYPKAIPFLKCFACGSGRGEVPYKEGPYAVPLCPECEALWVDRDNYLQDMHEELHSPSQAE